jgi:hypothetical protein
MCQSYKRTCECGSQAAEFTMRDEIMPPDVVKMLYCPSCGSTVEFQDKTMVNDNGWIIEYDMELAEFYSHQLGASPEAFCPDYIFDEGYCSWAGYCPGDMERAALEKAEIVKMMKVDPKAYIGAIKDWGHDRARRLAEEGWRKATAAL